MPAQTTRPRFVAHVKQHSAVLLIALGYCLLMAIDMYKSPDTVQKYLFISSRVFTVLFLIFCLFIRFRHQTLPTLLTNLNRLVILPYSLVLGVGLTILTRLHPENTVYSVVPISSSQLTLLAATSIAVLLIGQTNHWWHQNWRYVIGISAPLLLLAFLVLRLWPQDFFLNFVQEDREVEWAQFFVLLISSVIALLSTIRLWSRYRIGSLLYFILTLGTLFIAGDEISWGQRLIGFAAPEAIASQNAQQEITVHNLYFFTHSIWFLYMVISAYGVISWWLAGLLPQKLQRLAFLVVPPVFSAPYFLLSFVYQAFANPAINTRIGEWSEPSELSLYLGICFYFLNTFMVSRSIHPVTKR